MGMTALQITLHGPLESAEVEVVVDTGATFTKIPRSTATRLGLSSHRSIEVQLSDGRRVQRELAIAEVIVEGERGYVPVAIGEEDEPALLGYTTLEILGFKVNPVTRQLEKTLAIEYHTALSSRE
jgi:clan AA aspartic protease